MRPVYILFLWGCFAVFLEVITGGILFVEKYTLFPEKIQSILAEKSLYGLLELHYPHFFAVFLTVFVVLHFFYFFKLEKIHFFTATGLFMASFLNFFSVFPARDSLFFAFLKVFSFVLFILGIVFVFFWLVLLTFRKLRVNL
ncbi:hypothetical protein [Persephonella sp.]